jgi:hypothetical protein
MAMALDMRPTKQSRQWTKEKTMKRTLTILSAALFAGALMVPTVQAQAPAAPAAPAAAASAAPAPEAPAAEATPAKKKHHMRHHHKKSSMKGGSSPEATPAAPSGGSD